MVTASLARLVQQASAAAADVGRAAAANPRTRKAVLELTDAAAARIRDLLSQRHKVRGGPIAGRGRRAAAGARRRARRAPRGARASLLCAAAAPHVSKPSAPPHTLRRSS
jgi:hypothetical protein